MSTGEGKGSVYDTKEESKSMLPPYVIIMENGSEQQIKEILTSLQISSNVRKDSSINIEVVEYNKKGPMKIRFNRV